MDPPGSVRGVLTSSEVPLERLENRIRAHVRQRMESRGLGVTRLAELVEIDQPYLSRWLRSERGSGGISAKFAYRLMKRLDIEADNFFNLDPEERFWRNYVPRPGPDTPEHASMAPARASRRARGGGA